jgi:hypothetical protein
VDAVPADASRRVAAGRGRARHATSGGDVEVVPASSCPAAGLERIAESCACSTTQKSLTLEGRLFNLYIYICERECKKLRRITYQIFEVA